MRSGLLALLLIATLAALSVTAPAVDAENQSAVVSGITKLFVRRGPGMQFPPFASLSEGSSVEIQNIEGEWARIITANGQVGYVQRRYLESGQREPAASATRAAATATRVAVTPTQRPTRTAIPERSIAPTAAANAATATVSLAPLATRTAAITVRIAATATRTAALPPTASASAEAVASATVEAPGEAPAPPAGNELPAPPANVDSSAIYRELQTLRVAVERLQRRLDEYSGLPSNAAASTALNGDPSSISGGAVLLALVGAGIGWFLGSSYTRKQERGRRSRIRF